MRVAVFVVFVAFVPVLATPSEASRSCMTKTEARQHFGSVHLYWHGAGHCWDATSTRRHHRVHKVQRKISPPKWRESMSKMLPDDVEDAARRTAGAENMGRSLGRYRVTPNCLALGGYRPGHAAAARHRSQIRADGHAARRDDGDHRHHTDACNRRVSVHRHEIGRIHSQTALTTAEGARGPGTDAVGKRRRSPDRQVARGRVNRGCGCKSDLASMI